MVYEFSTTLPLTWIFWSTYSPVAKSEIVAGFAELEPPTTAKTTMSTMMMTPVTTIMRRFVFVFTFASSIVSLSRSFSRTSKFRRAQ